tara:strand:- start:3214 stop:3588 length:375 start_codon:yes stop_codon:yes gene_type:complete
MGIKKNFKNQKGGRVTLPSEYFGQNSGRYFEAGAKELNIQNSAYGKNNATSRGILIDNNLMGPELGPTSTSGLQTGGSLESNKFMYITNPATKRKVNIYGKIGRKVLQNYMNVMNGGVDPELVK